MISFSLRRQLFVAFAFVILLTVLLSGAFAAWTTSSRFEVLITEQGRQRAYEVAPLLEASYTFHGDWDGVVEMLRLPPDQALFFEDEGFVDWGSTVDWYEVVAAGLEIDIDVLFVTLDEVGSLADTAVYWNVDPDYVVDMIVMVEEEAVATAVENGELSLDEAALYMQYVMVDADGFVYEMSSFVDEELEYVDWDLVIREELSLSEAAYFDRLATQSLPELAAEQGVPLAQIEQALIDAEIELLQPELFYTENEYLLATADMVAWVRAYVRNDDFFPVYPAGPPLGAGLLTAYLLGDEQLFLLHSDGTIIYDSISEREGELLPSGMTAEAVPLFNLSTHDEIGLVLVATGTGFYNGQQQTFLRGMTFSLVVSGVIVVFVGLMIAAVLSRQITSPVTALTEAAQQLATGRSTQRLAFDSKNELGQMSQSFNQMADALQAQQALRRRLVRDVSHELNTPLSVIQLELETLNYGMQTPAEAHAHVQHEIDLLRRLVDDLTQLTESDQAQMSLDMTLLDAVPIARQAVARLSPRAESLTVQLEMVEPENELPLIEADVARLKQVLANLIDNALRHTAANGRVVVSCRVVRLSQLALPAVFRPVAMTDSDRPWLVTTVSDSGVGIAENDLPFLFERFYRADESRNRNSGGRGLGLSIVRQIVEAHGGFVWAANGVTEGSVFGYALPLADEADV